MPLAKRWRASAENKAAHRRAVIRLGGDYLLVEAKGHLRVGMSGLRHDVRHIGPGGEQKGNEGPAQRVRRHVGPR